MSRSVIISVFKNEDDVLGATTAARKQGLDIVDVYTPYAVHGLDRAMGLPPSRLPWVTFVLGLTGALSMTLFQYWASAVDWPINVGGKPWHSWPAFAPVIFEVTVLLGGVGTSCFIYWRLGRPVSRPTCVPTIASRSCSDRVPDRPRAVESLPDSTRSRSRSDELIKALTIGLAVALLVSIGLNIAAAGAGHTNALEYFPDMARTADNAFESGEFSMA
jgi:hypothetical protein